MKLSSRFNWYSEQKVFPYLESVQEEKTTFKKSFAVQREQCSDGKNRKWTEDWVGSVARAGRAVLTAALIQQLQVPQLSTGNF